MIDDWYFLNNLERFKNTMEYKSFLGNILHHFHIFSKINLKMIWNKAKTYIQTVEFSKNRLTTFTGFTEKPVLSDRVPVLQSLYL